VKRYLTRQPSASADVPVRPPAPPPPRGAFVDVPGALIVGRRGFGPWPACPLHGPVKSVHHDPLRHDMGGNLLVIVTCDGGHQTNVFLPRAWLAGTITAPDADDAIMRRVCRKVAELPVDAAAV
jgi:hypothetical protein